MTIDYDDRFANAAYIPNADGFISDWTDQAAAFRQKLLDQGRAELGVSYGPSDRQAWDMFAPTGTPRGTVVFVHGGYWLRFDRSFWSHFAAGALDRGWRVVMPSYDLCPTVSIAQITGQIATAVTQIAARFDGPLSLTGHSAGGHLVGRMAHVLPDAVTQRITHIAPISPVADLREIIHTKMNADFALTPDIARDESLVCLPAPTVPTSVWVGTDERPVFIEQAQALGQVWGCHVTQTPNRHHFDIIDALRDANSDLTLSLTRTE